MRQKATSHYWTAIVKVERLRYLSGNQQSSHLHSTMMMIFIKPQFDDERPPLKLMMVPSFQMRSFPS